MKNTERFSNRVHNYIKYRPSYPVEVLAYLKEQIGLSPDWTIADIGSGTGISSELFLNNGNKVIGVEPNQAMREAAEELLTKQKKFASVNGTAEHTTLEARSIDLIVAGQSFHWFDLDKTKAEFQRILKPSGYVLLMWNNRQRNSPFLQGYEEMLKKYALDYVKVEGGHADELKIAELFAPQKFSKHVFEHFQLFDFESLKGRLLSSSYAPLEGHPNYQPMLESLKRMFDETQLNGSVHFDYDCKLYYGQL